MSAYGALRLGLAPDGGDLVRILAFYVTAVVYVSLWLALALLLSVVCRRAATAAFAAIAIWLVLTLFAGLIAGVIADAVHPAPADASTEQVLDNARAELTVRRFSPDELYREATGVLLNPSRQSTGIVVVDESNASLPSTLVAGPEPPARLVAARRARGRDDRDVRRRVPRVPPPGGPRLTRAPTRSGAGHGNWAGIVPLVDLGGIRLGCCDDSRPDRRLVGPTG